MRKPLGFESDDKKIRIQPIIMVGGDLAYIRLTVYDSNDVNVNTDQITELIELLTEVKQVYIDKLDLLK